MAAYPIPANEAERLATLRNYHILDTPPDPFFDDIALLASIICQTPIALVSLVDKDRQWFKAKVGLSAEETSRDVAFCAHTIMGSDIMEIEDATKDSRFQNNPLVLKDPKIRFYAGTPLVTSNSYPMGTLCVVDREKRKLTRDQLTALDSLGRQVVALLELHRSYIELKKLGERKDEFIRIASHDLKNPLQVILGASSLFEGMARPGTPINEDLYNMVAQIPKKSRIMKKIIEDFIDFEAIEDGYLKIERTEVNLNDLAHAAYEDHIEYAHSKNISLNTDLQDELPTLPADGNRIRQVMDNLIGNAIKFSHSATNINIRTFAKAGKALFEVRDGGAGIPPDDMDKLFSRYSRLSNKPTGDEKSTGLGLSICKGLIELHKGNIGAYNNPDGGATFWFELPMD